MNWNKKKKPVGHERKLFFFSLCKPVEVTDRVLVSACLGGAETPSERCRKNIILPEQMKCRKILLLGHKAALPVFDRYLHALPDRETTVRNPYAFHLVKMALGTPQCYCPLCVCGNTRPEV